jgi:CubicO group peptidase (beta-lactamase class C family)
MMLHEEGKLLLTDPVSRYLPQLAKLQVGVEKRDPATGQVTLALEPARPMTIQDLLRHTAGLTYGVFGTGAVKKMYTDTGVDGVDQTNAELIDRLARVPLMFQPGTTYEYSRATDVLGRIVEVVSGQTLAQFLRSRLFEPLRMTDSAFFVPADRHDRIAQALAKDPDTGQPIRLLDVATAPKFEAGGQGAVGTAADYVRFAQMMLNRASSTGRDCCRARPSST